jgi:uncharacterized RDD family membrane protein YckC
MTGFHDQLSIDTPEQVELRFPISGVGSRFLAVLVDTLIQVFTYLLVILILVLIASSFPSSTTTSATSKTPSVSDNVIYTFLFLFHFCLYAGYFTLFEAFWNGQTPGKRIFKIRVIKDSGRQLTFFEALARNMLRLIDSFPIIYLVGVIAMSCNRQQKRLGDLAAGTMVVHEQSESTSSSPDSSRLITAAIFSAPAPQDTIRRLPADAAVPADAVARLSPNDLNVIETFFARAIDLDVDKRADMAARLMARLSEKMMISAPPGVNPEHQLESIAYTMRGQGTHR